jgi:hypothetical protein
VVLSVFDLYVCYWGEMSVGGNPDYLGSVGLVAQGRPVVTWNWGDPNNYWLLVPLYLCGWLLFGVCNRWLLPERLRVRLSDDHPDSGTFVLAVFTMPWIVAPFCLVIAVLVRVYDFMFPE